MTYSVSPQSGRQPYSYQWYRDGVAIAGATAASYGYAATRPESFRLSETTRSSDGQSVSSYMDLSWYWTLAVAGPSSVKPNGPNCTWTASLNGGVVPLTYRWRNNAVVVGGNSPTLTLVAPGSGTLVLDLLVTDGAGNTLSWATNVPVSSSGDPCTSF